MCSARDAIAKRRLAADTLYQTCISARTLADSLRAVFTDEEAAAELLATAQLLDRMNGGKQ